MPLSPEGLGWTFFKKEEMDWSSVQILSKMLPVGNITWLCVWLVEGIGSAVRRRKELENSASLEDGVSVSNIKDVDDGGAFLGQPVGVVAPNVYVDEDPVEKLVKEIVEEERVFSQLWLIL